MRMFLVISCCLFLISCNSKRNVPVQLTRVNHAWLDSICNSADTTYVKKYVTLKFANTEYFIDGKDSMICQVMKDSLDSIRQIIITKKNKRNFFAEFYSNGQLIAQLPVDSFGHYNGASKYFYQTGFVESEGEYKRGLKTGIWKDLAINGKLISLTEYDSNCQVIKTKLQQNRS